MYNVSLAASDVSLTTIRCSSHTYCTETLLSGLENLLKLTKKREPGGTRRAEPGESLGRLERWIGIENENRWE